MDSGERMIVRCPRCSSRYQLPERLMGSRGARVSCPRCGTRFDVAREAPPRRAIELPRAPEAEAAPEPQPTPAPSREVALEVVEDLAPHVARLRHAQARGRLFAEAGTLLLQAFDEYRRRAGAAAGAAVFREALRSRWNIDLPGQDLLPAE